MALIKIMFHFNVMIFGTLGLTVSLINIFNGELKSLSYIIAIGILPGLIRSTVIFMKIVGEYY